jgi:hypothetical protein
MRRERPGRLSYPVGSPVSLKPPYLTKGRALIETSSSLDINPGGCNAESDEQIERKSPEFEWARNCRAFMDIGVGSINDQPLSAIFIAFAWFHAISPTGPWRITAPDLSIPN